MSAHDVVVVGAGPNGLSAAIVLAQAGLDVLVLEAHPKVGGGMRSAELTLPGFMHDVCSTVHPLGAASPFFRSLDLARHGLEWLQPPAALAHVLGDGRVFTLERSVDETARRLGRDGPTYRALVEPYVEHFDRWIEMVLGPLRWPSDPLLFARFGLHALLPMERLAARFSEPAAGALLAGIAAHAMLPLSSWVTASFGLVLGVSGHGVGWPIARGGSQAIADALVACLHAHGGAIATERRVRTWEDLPAARAYVFDLTPKQLLAIAGPRLPRSYRRRLEHFRYGAGVFKMDWALAGPIPWRDAECARSATVHLSGDLQQIAASCTRARSRCWCNPRCSITRARQRANTSPGPTVTSHTALTSTPARTSNSTSNSLHRVFAT